MKKRIRQALGLMLAFVTLFGATAQYGLQALHAEEKKDTQLSGMYEWHRAMTVDDLRGAYNEMTGLRDGYDNQWVPIIIVAEYKDGTQYYINRNTKLAKRDSEQELIPFMNPVSSSDSVGLMLSNGMKSEDTFITKGNLGAMHMYYHGVAKHSYGDNYIQAEAWSLTNEAVTDYSSKAVETVYGVEYLYDNKYLAARYCLDQNKVERWGESGSLPLTQSPNDTDWDYKMYTGWTFQPDRKDGYFLISDMFAQRVSDSSLSGIDAPTWGCALDGKTRYASPNIKRRNMIETPSRAAAFTRGDDGNVVQIEENTKTKKLEINNTLLKKMQDQYDNKYDNPETRVWFKIYIGKELEGSVEQQTGSITGTKDYRLSGTNIAKGVEITVEEGATLTIKENTYCYLDGTITNKGTIIVEKGATITSAAQGPGDAAFRTGKIDCQGGKLLVMEGAKLYLAEGLLLNNNASVVNRGLIIVGDTFEFNDSMIQMADGGRLMIGFANNSPSTFHYKTLDNFSLEKEIDNTGGDDCAPTLCDYSKRNANSKIILEKNSAVDIGCYSAEFDSNKTVWFPDLVVGLDQGAEKFYATMEYRTIHSYFGGYTFGKDNGSFSPIWPYDVYEGKYYDDKLLLYACYECKN